MAEKYVYTNYSNGWVIEHVTNPEGACSSYLLLPAENLWSAPVRGILYSLGLIYCFIGVAISSDIFMCSIEIITSKRRTIVRWDEERQERVERAVLVWNETVANLTLMALGSSAPEILLAVVETLSNLGTDTSQDDGLGTFTIIGSAAFNLLVITAICIISVPSPNVKRIQELGVFVLTSFWSIFAYLWMLIVLTAITPNEIEPWEAWVTIAFFPIMVLTAYCQDNHWWCRRHKTVGIANTSQPNVRVVLNNKSGGIHGMARELGALEKEKNQRASRMSLRSLNEKESDENSNNENGETALVDPVKHVGKDGDSASQLGSQLKLMKTVVQADSSKQTFARARFRHATVRSILGGRKHHVPKDQQLIRKQSMADVVMAMRKSLGKGDGPQMPSDEEMLGKFTFASPSYSVLESSGIMEIDILFHRLQPSKASHLKLANGSAAGGENETSFTTDAASAEQFVHKGVVSVEFETREGSAKIDKDFKYTAGSLVFSETEYRKSITIPIINDMQYEADVDFYVILKNPSGDAGISDPNITRVMIIDDDEPGEFQFEEPHYYADISTGQIIVNVTRQKGCDGTVSIEYSTIDGTARGGDDLRLGVDYIQTENVINFKHGETTKPIVIEINKETKGSKNFIITLRNPSIGAKIGDHSATVCNVTSDNIAERLAEVIGDDEEVTWSGQFKSALSLECEQDDEGNDIPLKWYDYVIHFVTFFWKVLLACIPPRVYLGAWPAFVISLGVIGVQTMIIEQLGTLLGCVTGLKSAVAGITIIALGTSLPDTFASRSAALHDEGADAAIGNITGSNSVNVFLGLGLPWVIQSIYNTITKEEFRVKTTNLTQSVILFSIVGTICIIMLLIRRPLVGGELGGKSKIAQYGCGFFLIFLWILYIVLSSIKAYHPDDLPW